MAAFKAAVGRNDFVELDVGGFSKDGEAVIIHDSTLTRTSDAAEIDTFKSPYEVTDYTLSRLKTLDMSSWFIKSDSFGSIKAGLVSADFLYGLPVERIPTLQEALIFFKRAKMPVNIEIKDMSGTKFDSRASESVVRIIYDLQCQESVLVSSFNHDYLKQYHILAPEISTAVLVEKNHPDDLMEYVLNLNANAYHAESGMLDREVVTKLRSVGIAVNAYTVNTHDEMNRMFGMGVTAVFSDVLEML